MIVLNQLYAGEYPKEEPNIGHDIINTLQDDNGKNYLYITSSGSVPKPYDIDAIVFVRNLSNKQTAEVVAVAKDLSVFGGSTDDVKYDGVSYSQIYDDAPITFEADQILVPANNRSVILTMQSDFPSNENYDNAYIVRLHPSKSVLFSQSMRGNYSEADNLNTYNDLLALVDNKSLWEVSNVTIKDLQSQYKNLDETDEDTLENVICKRFLKKIEQVKQA